MQNVKQVLLIGVAVGQFESHVIKQVTWKYDNDWMVRGENFVTVFGGRPSYSGPRCWFGLLVLGSKKVMMRSVLSQAEHEQRN